MATKTDEQWSALSSTVRDALPSELGPQAWYLLISCALVASPQPELLAQFYKYLITSDLLPSQSSTDFLSIQLRDMLLKQVTLLGAPQVLMAFTPLAAAEGTPTDKAPQSTLSSRWQALKDGEQSVQQIHDRGVGTIHSIYGKTLLHDRIFPQWGLHTRDVQLMELFTVYGMYLSDFEVLTPIETELVVWVTIMSQGLGLGPALWHMRGLGRLLGARGADDGTEQMGKVKDMLRQVKVCAMTVVDFVGEEFHRKAKIDGWPNVGDVVRVLQGWGEDG